MVGMVRVNGPFSSLKERKSSKYLGFRTIAVLPEPIMTGPDFSSSLLLFSPPQKKKVARVSETKIDFLVVSHQKLVLCRIKVTYVFKDFGEKNLNGDA